MEQTKPRATVTNTRADSMCLSHAHAHARGHTVRLFHAEPSNTPALWRCVNTRAHTNTRVWEDLWGSHTNSGSNTVLKAHTGTPWNGDASSWPQPQPLFQVTTLGHPHRHGRGTHTAHPIASQSLAPRHPRAPWLPSPPPTFQPAQEAWP